MSRHKFTTRHKRLMIVGAGATALAAAIGLAATAGASETPAERTSSWKPVVVKVEFAPASEAAEADAVTYNTELVPVGSRVRVKEVRGLGGATLVELRVKDLAADRTYGAHVHTKPCGELPTAAGPHYQNELDPTQPSVDSKYANPKNEVWLDLTTNKDGTGRATAGVDWRFREGGARSVVIHMMATATHDGHAGTAGARLACVNVPFK
ncbi:superoxide dismutase family protein [Streptomyces sp. NPDC020898]|uniref:superoxide dismutase family protein n=1 Tax=Streptomyces sp. NPDC020898 TaxID=3365101 RepID=UPI0037AB9CB8